MSFSRAGNPKPPLLKKFPAFALSLCPQDKPAKEDAHEPFLETKTPESRPATPIQPILGWTMPQNATAFGFNAAAPAATDDRLNPSPTPAKAT